MDRMKLVLFLVWAVAPVLWPTLRHPATTDPGGTWTPGGLAFADAHSVTGRHNPSVHTEPSVRVELTNIIRVVEQEDSLKAIMCRAPSGTKRFRRYPHHEPARPVGRSGTAIDSASGFQVFDTTVHHVEIGCDGSIILDDTWTIRPIIGRRTCIHDLKVFAEANTITLFSEEEGIYFQYQLEASVAVAYLGPVGTSAMAGVGLKGSSGMQWATAGVGRQPTCSPTVPGIPFESFDQKTQIGRVLQGLAPSTAPEESLDIDELMVDLFVRDMEVSRSDFEDVATSVPERRFNRRLAQTSDCAIEDYNLQFTKATIPDESHPLAIVLPIFVFLEGVSPSSATIDDIDLDLACTVGSEPGLLRQGSISNRRTVENGVMVDCKIEVNNDNDCEWNLIEVFGSASLPGTTCSREAKSTATYCRNELTVHPPEESAVCQIGTFNVNFGEAIPDENDPKKVRFPLTTLQGDIVGLEDTKVFTRSCSVGDKEGDIVDNSDGGEEAFYCVVSFDDETDCDNNIVTVRSSMSVTGVDGSSNCSRKTTRTMIYCVEPTHSPPPPTPLPPPEVKKCVIHDFNAMLLPGTADPANPKEVTFPVRVPYGNILPEGVEETAEFSFKCSSRTGDGKIKEGQLANRKDSAREITFDCQISLIDPNDCSSTVSVEASAKIPAQENVIEECSRQAVSVVNYCNPTHPPPPPPSSPPAPVVEVKECKIGAINVRVSAPIPKEGNPGTVTFPVRIPQASLSPEELRSEAVSNMVCFSRTGAGKEQDAVILNRKEIGLDVAFDCEVAFLDINDCSAFVTVESSLEIPGKEGSVAGCKREASSTRFYCNPTPPPLPPPPQSPPPQSPPPPSPPKICDIHTFNVDLHTPERKKAVPEKMKASFPFTTIFGDVSPAKAEKKAKFDFSCFKQSSDGKKTAGKVKTTKKSGVVVGSCEVEFEATSDCEEDVVTLEGVVAIPSTNGYDECSRKAMSSVTYCPPQPKPEKCEIEDFNVVFLPPEQTKSEETVTFPVFVPFGKVTPVESLPGASFQFECGIGEGQLYQKGVVKKTRSVEGGMMYECEIILEDPHDCDGNVITANGGVTIEETDGVKSCKKQAKAETNYCVPVEKKDDCEVEKVDVDVVKINPRHIGTSIFLNAEVLLQVTSRLATKDIEKNLKCSVEGKQGKVTWMEDAKNGFKASCQVRMAKGKNLGRSKLKVEAKAHARGKGQYVSCEESMTREIEIQPKKKSSGPEIVKPKPKARVCHMQDLDARIINVKPVAGAVESQVDALVEVTYGGYKHRRSDLRFHHACYANGLKGVTKVRKEKEDGYIFSCRVQVADPYKSLHDVIEARVSADIKYRSKTICGHEEVVATFHHCKRPECSLYPLEMGYEGHWGIVTDRAVAEFAMVCTDPVDMCEDCVQTEPGFTNIDSVEPVDDTHKVFHIKVSHGHYRKDKEFHIGVEKARRAGECKLALKNSFALREKYPLCPPQIFKTVAPVKGLKWKYLANQKVEVKFNGYRIRSSFDDDDSCEY